MNTKQCRSCLRDLPLSEFHLVWKDKTKLKSRCKACESAKNRAYRQANAERLKAQQDARKERKQQQHKERYANPEYRKKLRAQNKRWKKLNPEVDKEHRRKWMASNREKTIAMNQRRRARKLAKPDNFTSADWKRAIAYFSGCCAYCGNQQGFFYGTKLSAEHFISLSSPDCPGTVPGNIIPACLSCNSSRKSQDVTRWLTERVGKKRATAALKKIAEYFASLEGD